MICHTGGWGGGGVVHSWTIGSNIIKQAHMSVFSNRQRQSAFLNLKLFVSIVALNFKLGLKLLLGRREHPFPAMLGRRSPNAKH